MLKDERLDAIVQLVDQKGTIRVLDIQNELGVSDMTIRRDLTELEDRGLIKRIHGGAKSLKVFRDQELSHADKQIINIREKTEIAEKALELIHENETIFLGPGTTIELLANLLDKRNLRIITNCLPVFETLVQKNNDNKVYLLGGEMRMVTKSFFGEITNLALADMRFHKVFLSANAVKDGNVMTATIEEGQTQAIALNNAIEKYLLVDTSKIDKEDFYAYYTLDKMTSVIINQDEYNTYEKLTKDVAVIV